MKKIIIAIVAVVFVISLATTSEAWKVKRLVKVYPQLFWKDPSAQLLVIGGTAIPNCPKNQMFFYQDEQMIFDVAFDAAKNKLPVWVTYETGWDPAEYIQEIGYVDCRVISIGY